MKILKFGFIELTRDGNPVAVNIRGIMNVKPAGYVRVPNEDTYKAMIIFLDSDYLIFDEDFYEVQNLILKTARK